MVRTTEMDEVIFSEDGIPWHYYSRNSRHKTSRFAFGNGTYLSFDYRTGTIGIQFDGITWGFKAIGFINDGAYGNNTFVVGGNSGIFISTDYGVSRNNVDSGTWLNDTAFGNNIFVATIYGGVIISIDNGITWTYNSNLVSGSLNGIIYGNSSLLLLEMRKKFLHNLMAI